MSQVPSSLPPSVPPLGALSAATRVANEEAKSKGTMMLLTNFVLIIVVFLSLFWPSWLPTVGGHILPFTPSFGKFCAALQKRRFFRARRAAETNTRTCEHNGNSAAIRESIVLPR